uniref:DSPc domain-containing protein n=1 Tax=Angiostrongylus cantonensis TaxID=6313 RepID=A0A0K0DNJ4_ANGCA
MLTTLAFYPSLGYNLLRNYLQPNIWMWYSRVDRTLVVGALPFKSMQEELITDWLAAGVAFHHIPMVDFFGSAGRAQIDSAVKFIENISSTGKSVYVHCKVRSEALASSIARCFSSVLVLVTHYCS